MRVILDFAKRRFRKKKKKKKRKEGNEKFQELSSYRLDENKLEPIPGNVSNIVSKLALSFWKRGGKRRKEERKKKKKRMKKEKKLESFGRHVPRKSR